VSASPPPSTVGLLHQARDSGSGVVVGRLQAIEDFTRALARHGALHEYALFCDARQQRALGPSLDALGGARLRAVDRARLAAIDELGLTAWHDADFDTHRPFAIRATARRAYPVTLVHHTLSYKVLLHDVLRLLLSRAHPFDAVVCTSVAAREALRRMLDHVARDFEREHGLKLSFEGRLETIPLAVDTDLYRPVDRSEARARFGFGADETVFLWLGRLSIIDKADLLPLLQAFEALRRANPARRVRLVCAGTDRPGESFGRAIGEYAGYLGLGSSVNVMTDRATFMPHKPALYSAADAFVSPVDNVQETFGLTPIEAMACGVPQIVSDWDGYRDTVVDGETGFLVPTTWTRSTRDLDLAAATSDPAFDHLAMAESVVVDGPALLRAMQRLLDEPGLRARMAEASRRRAVASFSWAPVVARYESLWQELSAEARRDGVAPHDGLRYATPSWGSSFSHYATRALDDSSVVVITDRGRALARGETQLFATYIEQWQVLDVNLLGRALTGLVAADQRGSTLSVGRVADVLTKGSTDRASRDRVTRHVLFLMKYGYAALVEPSEGS